MASLSEMLSTLKRRVMVDRKNTPAIAVAVRKLGVSDPANPSAQDFKMVWDAYLKDKSLNAEAFNTYVKSLSVPLKSMFEGFAQFSADTREVSRQTIHIIDRAMDILQAELSRENISDSERQESLERVLQLVAAARDESEKERSFRSRLANGILAVVAIISGVLILVVTLGKYPKLAEKGFEMAAKAFGSAAA